MTQEITSMLAALMQRMTSIESTLANQPSQNAPPPEAAQPQPKIATPQRPPKKTTMPPFVVVGARVVLIAENNLYSAVISKVDGGLGWVHLHGPSGTCAVRGSMLLPDSTALAPIVLPPGPTKATAPPSPQKRVRDAVEEEDEDL